MSKEQLILKTTCKAGRGIVAAVSSFLADRDCYINELSQFDDQDSETLFMRLAFVIQREGLSKEDVIDDFKVIADDFEMDWQIHGSSAPTRTLIMVSRFDHCLADLLYRH